MRQLAPDLWIVDRSLAPPGLPFLDIGTRMTVIRLPGGGLLLHSPVAADGATRAAVEALGPVRFVVAPNRVHHLFAGAWKAAHPAARLLVAPGLPEKRPDLAIDGLLGDEPDPAWGGALDCHLVRGAPHLNEVAFLHRPSRTLLLTDLVFHPTSRSGRGLRAWTWLTRVRGGFGPNLVVRLLLRDRRAARASLDHILGWDFDRITLTHGEVLERGGRDALARAYAWL